MGWVGEREAEMRSRRYLTAALFKWNKLSSSYSSIHNIVSLSHNDLSAIGKSTVGSKWNLIGSLQYPICNLSLEYVFSCVNKTSLMLYICPVNRRKPIPIKLLYPCPRRSDRFQYLSVIYPVSSRVNTSSKFQRSQPATLIREEVLVCWALLSL
jgi:hypothetical protein